MEKRIEELSINAWPSRQTLVYDGWVLRFGGSYTRRANSISPLYESKLSFTEKIEYCERLYSSAGLNTVFKLTDKGSPEGLDEFLSAQGYREEAQTSVQVLELPCAGGTIPIDFKAYESLDEGWFQSLCSINEVSLENAGKLKAILSGIVPERYFAELEIDGRLGACGVGVVENGFIGLYDIVVDKKLRGKGHGRRLMESMLCLGREKGASSAYLQVMLDNPAALKLYESLGFRELYKYWYRVKERCRENE